MRLLVSTGSLQHLGFSTTAAPLTPEDAAGHIGETATVCGVVASAKYEANAKSQPTLLDSAGRTRCRFHGGCLRRSSGEFSPPDLTSRQEDLCDGKIQRLPGEAGNRGDRGLEAVVVVVIGCMQLPKIKPAAHVPSGAQLEPARTGKFPRPSRVALVGSREESAASTSLNTPL